MFSRPDWRLPELYSEFLEARLDLLDLLAWEFLRRNAEYQDDAARYFVAASKAELPEASQSFGEHITARWGLHTPKAPAEAYYPSDSHDVPIFGIENFRSFTHFNDWHPHSGPKVLIPVDLSMPLDAIEESVMGAVRALRMAGTENGSVVPQIERTLSPRVYVEHLRILDGFKAGASIAEIGEVLQPGATNDPEDKQRDKRIRAAYKAALKMQAEGWKMLAGLRRE